MKRLILTEAKGGNKLRTEGLKGALLAVLVIASLITPFLLLSIPAHADPNPVISITVEPSSTWLYVGESEDFYAIATYLNGDNEYVTDDAQWTVNPPSAGSIYFRVVLGPPYCFACFTLENSENNVTVTASYMGYSDNALVFPWTMTVVAFGLENLYAVHLEKTLNLYQGSKLVVKFYTYGDGYENEKVIETFSPPWHVVKNENVRHPDDIGVKKVRLDLTTDNTENVIATIASFTVRKVDLEIRFSRIPGAWFLAPPPERTELETEFSRIPSAWFLAPS